MARRTALSGVRRVALSRIRYYVYYRVADDALQVLAFWHTSRGTEPPM
jgi:plasmid stabilization system protein ParE